MLTLLFALQAAAEPLPVIELEAQVAARRVEIERAEGVRLDVRAEPDAGSDVRVSKNPNAARGGKTLRNVRVAIDAEARIAPPGVEAGINASAGETPQPK